MTDDWQRPSRTGAGARFLHQRAREQESWETRLVALLVAVPIFELALMAGALIASGGRPAWAIQLLMQLPLAFHLALCSVALVVAAVWGMRGITGLLGHLFWTHPAPQQCPKTTASLWLALMAACAVLAVLIGRLS